MTEETRVCKVCKRELPLSEFRTPKSKKDGTGICRECLNKRNLNRKFEQNDKKVEFECEHCHKKFYVYKSSVEHGKHPRFCSKECQKAHYDAPTRICSKCGRELPLEKFPKNNHGRYDGMCKECLRKHNREAHFVKSDTRIELVCETCGKKFYVMPCEMKKKTPRFCSMECWRMKQAVNAINSAKNRWKQNGV